MENQSLTTIELKDGERLDDLNRNGYVIIQNEKNFCFGMDAVLLSGFVEAKEDARVLDIGTGTGIIPILLEAKKKGNSFVGLEVQKISADMARRSVALNKLEKKIDIICDDVNNAGLIFEPEAFDIVTTNPPYMIGKHGLTGENMEKAIARHEILCTFEDIVRESSRVLKQKGRMYIVHRPFRLVELFDILTKYKLEPKRMRLVYPFVDKEPNMVLIEALKGGNSRLKVEKPLIVYESPGKYTSEIYDVYGY